MVLDLVHFIWGFVRSFITRPDFSLKHGPAPPIIIARAELPISCKIVIDIQEIAPWRETDLQNLIQRLTCCLRRFSSLCKNMIRRKLSSLIIRLIYMTTTYQQIHILSIPSSRRIIARLLPRHIALHSDRIQRHLIPRRIIRLADLQLHPLFAHDFSRRTQSRATHAISLEARALHASRPCASADRAGELRGEHDK